MHDRLVRIIKKKTSHQTPLSYNVPVTMRPNHSSRITAPPKSSQLYIRKPNICHLRKHGDSERSLGPTQEPSGTLGQGSRLGHCLRERGDSELPLGRHRGRLVGRDRGAIRTTLSDYVHCLRERGDSELSLGRHRGRLVGRVGSLATVAVLVRSRQADFNDRLAHAVQIFVQQPRTVGERVVSTRERVAEPDENTVRHLVNPGTQTEVEGAALLIEAL